MLVLDAAAAVDLLLQRQPQASWVAEQIGTAAEFHSPHLLDVEVASAVRRRTLRGQLTADRAAIALRHLAELPILRYPVTHLLPRIFELRDSLTAYDAAYIVLAESLEVPLVTTDERLARSTGHTATILTPA